MRPSKRHASMKLSADAALFMAIDLARGVARNVRRTLDSTASIFAAAQRTKDTEVLDRELQIAIWHVEGLVTRCIEAMVATDVEVKLDMRRHIPRSRRIRNAATLLRAVAAKHDQPLRAELEIGAEMLGSLRFPVTGKHGVGA